MSSSLKRVALVTGGNKGIGYNIVELLARSDPSLTVLLGSRDAARGQKAVTQLNRSNVKYISLDVTSDASLTKVAEEVQSTYGGLDLLCNNAGVFLKAGNDTDGSEDAFKQTMSINYFAVTRSCSLFLPLMKTNGRIVNVASQLGTSALDSMSDARRTAFTGAQSIQQVDQQVEQFRQAFVNRKCSKEGFPSTAYGVSKAAVIVASRIFAESAAAKEKQVTVYSACPGWCKTDMTSAMAPRSAEEGASMIVHVLNLPKDDKHSGTFWQNKAVFPY